MATLVCFHAHPDDEAISTGGVMAEAAADGHRVVLVVATRGELGEVADGVLSPGEALGERRVAETLAAADVLGVARVEFLGYRDSGMAGLPSNTDDGAFAAADVDEASERLAAVLRDENADVLTVYDANGIYGHPDHIQVHRIGRRAAERAGTPRVYETTIDRDFVVQGVAMMQEMFADDEAMKRMVADFSEMDEDATFGVPSDQITTTVDIRAFVDHKRRAMMAHASQIPVDSWFLTLPPEAFAWAFGTEWFIRVGAEAGTTETALFD
ncbi:MAG: PIG-L family deacetylase [Acidimicrobiales bacterium]